jgi:hypothetical protein
LFQGVKNSLFQIRTIPYPSQLKDLSKKEISLITGPRSSEKAGVLAIPYWELLQKPFSP